MTGAIELLMQEHREIERLLDALDHFSRAVHAGESPDPEGLAAITGLLRELADDRHHGKEEKILFAEMARWGFPAEGGPVGVMLVEHDEGREANRRLTDLAGAGTWSAEDREQVVSVADNYVMMLRAHIQKEDSILYVMASSHLPPEAMDAVSDRCAEFEEEWVAAGRMDWKEVDTLVQRLIPAS